MSRSLTDTSPAAAPAPNAVVMPTVLCDRLLRSAQALHAAGLKGFGLLIGDPGTPGHPFRPVDVVVFDPLRNRRNEPANRAAFHAQGSYFRQYEDAGFVADPADVLHVWRTVEASGLDVIAPFHVHRRQPANFSVIDYRLHNPAFAWHLIISLSDPAGPAIRPFAVNKPTTDFGIDERDGREGSEHSYQGPEVTPLDLVLTGGTRHLRRVPPTPHTNRTQPPRLAAG